MRNLTLDKAMWIVVGFVSLLLVMSGCTSNRDDSLFCVQTSIPIESCYEHEFKTDGTTGAAAVVTINDSNWKNNEGKIPPKLMLEVTLSPQLAQEWRVSNVKAYCGVTAIYPQPSRVEPRVDPKDGVTVWYLRELKPDKPYTFHIMLHQLTANPHVAHLLSEIKKGSVQVNFYAK